LVDRRSIGANAESVAVRAISARGYVVVARNVRSRAGELDIICRDGDAFVFCEVKARQPSSFGVAVEAITAAKRRRLERLAQTYLARIGRRDAAYRLELIAVDLRGGEAERVRIVPLNW